MQMHQALPGHVNFQKAVSYVCPELSNFTRGTTDFLTYQCHLSVLIDGRKDKEESKRRQIIMLKPRTRVVSVSLSNVDYDK